METPAETTDFGLAPVLRVLRRRWGMIALCTFLVGAAAAAMSLNQTPQYTASANLLFRDPGFDFKLFGSGFFLPSADPERAAATNERLVGLSVVAERTAKQLGEGVTAGAVQGAVSSAQSGQSDVVVISAEWPKPVMAANIANTFAEQFIAFRRDADRAKIRESRELIEQQIEQLGSGRFREAAELRARVQQLEIMETLQTGNAELVQRASPPSSASSPTPRRDAILGLVIGLVIGLLLAFLFEHLDRRVREADDLATAYGLPLLAAVPHRRSREPQLTAAQMEVFHMLRARLRYFNVDRRISSMLVTSTAPGEGKTTIAWNLAMAHAYAGQRTLIIEADLRRPTLARVHDLRPAPGLADLVIGQVAVADALQSVPVPSAGGANGASAAGPRLDVIVAGPLPPNPGALLESHMFDELIAKATSIYDIVIIDTPPVSVVSDALPLLSRVDGIIVVGRIGVTRTDEVRRLREQIEAVEAPALGVVANAVRVAGSRYYGYGYGGYEPLEDAPEQRQDPREPAPVA